MTDVKASFHYSFKSFNDTDEESACVPQEDEEERSKEERSGGSYQHEDGSRGRETSHKFDGPLKSTIKSGGRLDIASSRGSAVSSGSGSLSYPSSAPSHGQPSLSHTSRETSYSGSTRVSENAIINDGDEESLCLPSEEESGFISSNQDNNKHRTNQPPPAARQTQDNSSSKSGGSSSGHSSRSAGSGASSSRRPPFMYARRNEYSNHHDDDDDDDDSATNDKEDDESVCLPQDEEDHKVENSKRKSSRRTKNQKISLNTYLQQHHELHTHNTRRGSIHSASTNSMSLSKMTSASPYTAQNSDDEDDDCNDKRHLVQESSYLPSDEEIKVQVSKPKNITRNSSQSSGCSTSDISLPEHVVSAFAKRPQYNESTYLPSHDKTLKPLETPKKVRRRRESAYLPSDEGTPSTDIASSPNTTPVEVKTAIDQSSSLSSLSMPFGHSGTSSSSSYNSKVKGQKSVLSKQISDHESHECETSGAEALQKNSLSLTSKYLSTESPYHCTAIPESSKSQIDCSDQESNTKSRNSRNLKDPKNYQSEYEVKKHSSSSDLDGHKSSSSNGISFSSHSIFLSSGDGSNQLQDSANLGSSGSFGINSQSNILAPALIRGKLSPSQWKLHEQNFESFSYSSQGSSSTVSNKPKFERYEDDESLCLPSGEESACLPPPNEQSPRRRQQGQKSPTAHHRPKKQETVRIASSSPLSLSSVSTGSGSSALASNKSQKSSKQNDNDIEEDEESACLPDGEQPTPQKNQRQKVKKTALSSFLRQHHELHSRRGSIHSVSTKSSISLSKISESPYNSHCDLDDQVQNPESDENAQQRMIMEESAYLPGEVPGEEESICNSNQFEQSETTTANVQSSGCSTSDTSMPLKSVGSSSNTSARPGSDHDMVNATPEQVSSDSSIRSTSYQNRSLTQDNPLPRSDRRSSEASDTQSCKSLTMSCVLEDIPAESEESAYLPNDETDEHSTPQSRRKRYAYIEQDSETMAISLRRLKDPKNYLSDTDKDHDKRELKNQTDQDTLKVKDHDADSKSSSKINESTVKSQKTSVPRNVAASSADIPSRNNGITKLLGELNKSLSSLLSEEDIEILAGDRPKSDDLNKSMSTILSEEEIEKLAARRPKTQDFNKSMSSMLSEEEIEMLTAVRNKADDLHKSMSSILSEEEIEMLAGAKRNSDTSGNRSLEDSSAKSEAERSNPANEPIHPTCYASESSQSTIPSQRGYGSETEPTSNRGIDIQRSSFKDARLPQAIENESNEDAEADPLLQSDHIADNHYPEKADRDDRSSITHEELIEIQSRPALGRRQGSIHPSQRFVSSTTGSARISSDSIATDQESKFEEQLVKLTKEQVRRQRRACQMLFAVFILTATGIIGLGIALFPELKSQRETKFNAVDLAEEKAAFEAARLEELKHNQTMAKQNATEAAEEEKKKPTIPYPPDNLSSLCDTSSSKYSLESCSDKCDLAPCCWNNTKPGQNDCFSRNPYLCPVYLQHCDHLLHFKPSTLQSGNTSLPETAINNTVVSPSNETNNPIDSSGNNNQPSDSPEKGKANLTSTNELAFCGSPESDLDFGVTCSPGPISCNTDVDCKNHGVFKKCLTDCAIESFEGTNTQKPPKDDEPEEQVEGPVTASFCGVRQEGLGDVLCDPATVSCNTDEDCVRGGGNLFIQCLSECSSNDAQNGPEQLDGLVQVTFYVKLWFSNIVIQDVTMMAPSDIEDFLTVLEDTMTSDLYSTSIVDNIEVKIQKLDGTDVSQLVHQTHKERHKQSVGRYLQLRSGAGGALGSQIDFTVTYFVACSTSNCDVMVNSLTTYGDLKDHIEAVISDGTFESKVHIAASEGAGVPILKQIDISKEVYISQPGTAPVEASALENIPTNQQYCGLLSSDQNDIEKSKCDYHSPCTKDADCITTRRRRLGEPTDMPKSKCLSTCSPIKEKIQTPSD